MKKFFIMLCVALIPALTIVSCSSDDDDAPVPALAPTIEGTYPVDIYFGIGTDPDMSTPYDGTVTINATADNVASLSLAGFSIDGGSTEIPIALGGIQTSGTENAVQVSYEGPVQSEALETIGIIKTVLAGTVTGGKINFTLPVTVYNKDNESQVIMQVNVLLMSAQDPS